LIEYANQELVDRFIFDYKWPIYSLSSLPQSPLLLISHYDYVASSWGFSIESLPPLDGSEGPLSPTSQRKEISHLETIDSSPITSLLPPIVRVMWEPTIGDISDLEEEEEDSDGEGTSFNPPSSIESSSTDFLIATTSSLTIWDASDGGGIKVYYLRHNLWELGVLFSYFWLGEVICI